jgi:hypothetical protein
MSKGTEEIYVTTQLSLFKHHWSDHIKFRKHAAHGKVTHAYKILVGKHERKSHLEDKYMLEMNGLKKATLKQWSTQIVYIEGLGKFHGRVEGVHIWLLG